MPPTATIGEPDNEAPQQLVAEEANIPVAAEPVTSAPAESSTEAAEPIRFTVMVEQTPEVVGSLFIMRLLRIDPAKIPRERTYSVVDPKDSTSVYHVTVDSREGITQLVCENTSQPPAIVSTTIPIWDKGNNSPASSQNANIAASTLVEAAAQQLALASIVLEDNQKTTIEITSDADIVQPLATSCQVYKNAPIDRRTATGRYH